MQHNVVHSMQKRLPDEIWCAIWEPLPFFDRVRILRVCRAWRTVALNAPALWSRILCFSTIHSEDCYCFDCKGHDEGHYVPRWPENPYPQRATNLHDLPRYLSLGRKVDLHLSVDIVEHMPGKHVIQSLAQACNPHASRLVTIHWRSGQHAALRQFLSQITLSSVRNITADWLFRDDETWDEYGFSDMAKDLDFPALAYLRLDDPRFRGDGAHANLPSLRSLTFYPRSCQEIAAALVACPSLTILQAHLSRIDEECWQVAPHVVEELRHAVRKASSVSFIIRHIDADAESWALSSFSEAAALSLVYLRFKGFRGCEMFGDLTGAVHLTWQSTAEGPSARAVDSTGRTRLLTVASQFGSCKELKPIYDVLTPPKIARLSVDASLWAPVVSELPAGLRATSIVLTIRSRDDLASQMPGPLTAALLPVLETLHIMSDPERDPPLGMDDVAAFIPRLGLALPLPHVVVGRRIAARNERLPLELAVRTSIE